MIGNDAPIQFLGLVSSVVLPLFNIPLIIRMIQRRSSADLSLFWAFGVFLCLIALLPSAWQSGSLVFRVFTIANIVLFSGVVLTVVYFRIQKK